MDLLLMRYFIFILSFFYSFGYGWSSTILKVVGTLAVHFFEGETFKSELPAYLSRCNNSEINAILWAETQVAQNPSLATKFTMPFMDEERSAVLNGKSRYGLYKTRYQYFSLLNRSLTEKDLRSTLVGAISHHTFSTMSNVNFWSGKLNNNKAVVKGFLWLWNLIARAFDPLSVDGFNDYGRAVNVTCDGKRVSLYELWNDILVQKRLLSQLNRNEPIAKYAAFLKDLALKTSSFIKAKKRIRDEVNIIAILETNVTILDLALDWVFRSKIKSLKLFWEPEQDSNHIQLSISNPSYDLCQGQPYHFLSTKFDRLLSESGFVLGTFLSRVVEIFWSNNRSFYFRHIPSE